MKNRPTFFLSSCSQINTLTWRVPQRISGRVSSATTGSPNDSPGNCSKIITTAVVAQWIVGHMHQTSGPGRPMSLRPRELVSHLQRNDLCVSPNESSADYCSKRNDRIGSPNESSGRNCSRVTTGSVRPMNPRVKTAAE